MTDSPSWLGEGGGAPAPAAPEPAPPAPDTFALNQDASTAATTSTPVAAASAAGGASTASAAIEADKDLPGVILFMRLLNMGAAAALMTCSILLIISIPSLANGVLAVYATIGGTLICCLETQLKFLRVMIAVNFGFLFDPIWRFLFYLLMASVCWAYDNLFGKIVAGVMVGVAVYNTYVLCRYPAYRKVREKIAEEEDKRIEARISKEVKRQAVRQLAK